MNDKRFESARIILGGENFGCDHREFAVWGLYEYGFRSLLRHHLAIYFIKIVSLTVFCPP